MENYKDSKIKAAMTVFMIVSMSLSVIICLMPTAMAAGERIEGKVTEAGTGDPLEDFEIFVEWIDHPGYGTGAHTDANGDYFVDLPGAGDYLIAFLNDTWSGVNIYLTIADAEVVTNLDYEAVPDMTQPMITNIEKGITDGISTINPTTINVTVGEGFLRNVEFEVYRYLDQGDITSNVSFIRGFSTRGQTNTPPGVTVEYCTMVEQSPGVNTSEIMFDGTTMGAWFGDGTDTWWSTLSEWNDTTLMGFSYYENDTIGANVNYTFPIFNKTTGAFEDLMLYNETTGVGFVDLSDLTGKLQLVQSTRYMVWGNIDPFTDRGQINVTPMIDLADIQPIVVDDVLSSGHYMINLLTQDFGGQEMYDFWNITVDNGPPVADAGENITVKQFEEVMFNGSASTDDMGIVNYTWNISGVEVYGWNGTLVPDTIGLYEVNLTVADLGLWTSMDTMYLNVTDGTPPAADAGENITALQNEEFMFNANMSTDDVDVFDDLTFEWTFNDTVQNVTLDGWNATHSLAGIGLYEVTLVVTDMNGNPSLPDMVYVNITDGLAPIADAGMDLTVKQFEEVVFNGTNSSDNVGLINYTWTFLENAINQTLFGAEPAYIFSFIGTYNVTLTVLDDAGMTGEDMVVVTVLDGEVPTADGGLNITGEVNETLTFNASASEDNVGIVAYSWAFGDNTTEVGMLVTHAYLAEGTYNVTLTCTDAEGNEGTDVITVTIVPVNHAPAIGQIAKQTATAGQGFTFSVPVSDEDITDSLTFELLDGPTGMTINAVTGAISWTPGAALAGQTFDVTVEVSDGKAAVNSTFQVEVVASDITVSIGPIKNEDGKAVKGADVTVFYGVERYEGVTDGNGITTIVVPGYLAGNIVNVKVSKDGYKDETFSGTISDTGTFTPSDSYPKLESKDAGEDYTFLVIVIIVLVVLALVLLSMRKPIEEEEDIDEDEEDETTEEE